MAFPSDLVHFTATEFNFPDSMDIGFLRWLDRVRNRAGVPFQITNDFRPEGAGLHGVGRAVDLNSRIWDATEKWKVASAIVFLSHEAPGAVEFEVVWNADPAKDRHFHLGVDPRIDARPEFFEADD